jgi:RimJ/RimL family protein N-acetyltransferase
MNKVRTRLETKRLRLRLFTPDDVQITYELGTDPDVIRYAENEPLKDLDEARKRLHEGPLADYEKYGYGRFAVELKETGAVIGFCGIKFIEEIGLPEVGFRYLKEYWGRGIGTEAAKACVEFARSDLDCKMLVALIMPENGASIRVAEKLGMTRGPLISIYGVEAYQYELDLSRMGPA